MLAAYRADARNLFTVRNCHALVRTGRPLFLAVELERDGWQAAYVVPRLTLERDGRKVSPQQIVTALRAGKPPFEALRELIDFGSPPVLDSETPNTQRWLTDLLLTGRQSARRA